MSEQTEQVALIGAPIEEGAGRPGCAMGPKALRIAGIAEAIAELGHEVTDLGDLTPAPMKLKLSGNAHNAGAIAAWAHAIVAAGERQLAAGRRVVYLGGDHALAFGSVGAALRHAKAKAKPLHVLWLDAHADFNTPATSPSGNMHGMPGAWFCGEPGFEGLLDGPRLDPHNFHVFGVRSIDREERTLLRDRGVDVEEMSRLDEFGVAPLLRTILDQVAAEEALLHVSLDVDFIDPDLAPGVGTTVPGGATFREAHLVMEMIRKSGLLCSLDLVELNPFLDDRGRSARLLADLTASVFGRRIYDRPTQAG